MNGLVSADREPHPGLLVVKRNYQYVHVKPVDLAAGKVNITNWHDFTPLDQALAGRWAVQADGVTIASGTIPPLKLGPRESKDVTLPLPPMTTQPGVESLPRRIVHAQGQCALGRSPRRRDGV